MIAKGLWEQRSFSRSGDEEVYFLMMKKIKENLMISMFNLLWINSQIDFVLWEEILDKIKRFWKRDIELDIIL